MLLNLNPFDKKSISSPDVTEFSALFKLANNSFTTGFPALTIELYNTQLVVAVLHLIRIYLGLNPVYTKVPSVELFPR